ncbi:MAG: UDP-N-acetylmuramoyl-L-alanyl-D-glutamate--2,6-diaminopimelate ligase [Chloroflexi bacterium]|nr:UDP-N-acetylmuramoyl-L-alanyl-D-glutamate--2,6-diaminopimelate ligase [Chloroflexota bacterium]
MKFRDLLAEVPGVLALPEDDAEITAPVSEKVQSVQPGGVFLARAGHSVDGHTLIDEAVARGAAAIVGTRAADEVAHSVPYAQVADGMQALGPLAAAYYGHPSRRLTVIGVTGTDGKTTTASLLHSILQSAGLRTGLLTTINALIGDQTLETGLHVTTPTADEVQMYLAQMVDAGLTHAVIEATSHGLSQGRVNGVKVNVAVMTNVTHEHLDFHGTWEQYRRDKARLFEMVVETAQIPGTLTGAVINAADPSADYFRELAASAGRVITYAADGMSADFVAQDIGYRADGTRFTLVAPGRQYTEVESSLVGPFNVANTLAAAAAASLLIEGRAQFASAMAEGVRRLPPIPGRMQPIDEGQDFLAIVDFAHTPNALRRALEAARSMISPHGRVIAVFGSAGLRDREKRRMMAEIGMELADLCVLTAEDPRTESLDAILEEMASGALRRGGVEEKTFWRVPDRGRAVAFACSLARSGDVVISCGKGHEQSMCFGTIEYPWDDRDALRAALRGTPLLTLPTAAES